MKIALLVFFIISTIVSIGTLVFVTVDIIREIKKKKEEQTDKREEPIPTPVQVKEPEKPSEPEITLPEAEKEISEHIVEHIGAEEADKMISDAVAMTVAREEMGAGIGQRTYINIGDIDKSFEANEIITLEALKEKGLVAKSVNRIKILADGELTKPLTVKAESFSIQAIKMIELTGGTVIILK